MKHPLYPKEFILRIIDKLTNKSMQSSSSVRPSENTCCEGISTGIALLWGEPDKEIWERLADKSSYASACALLLSALENEQELETFLKNTEVMARINSDVLKIIFQDNKKVRDALTTYYLGTSNKKEIKRIWNTKGYFATVQYLLLDILGIASKASHVTFRTSQAFDNDPCLYLNNLAEKAETLLKKTKKYLTPYNINALRVKDWVRPIWAGKEGYLSTLLAPSCTANSLGTLDDIYATLTLSAEVHKGETTIDVYAESLVHFPCTMRINDYANFIKSYTNKEASVLNNTICIKVTDPYKTPYERSETW